MQSSVITLMRYNDILKTEKEKEDLFRVLVRLLSICICLHNS